MMERCDNTRLALSQEYGEVWTTYYDIFVRHAFGSYADVLREVTYSPMMGHYLSFHNNYAYAVRKTNPDENYAREIMQLYSIGLWMLHMDGTRQLDASGQSILTYDNDDIMVSRILTPP